jgi:hypothetical protein
MGPDEVMNSGTPDAAANTPAAPAPKQPGLWQRVLTGALVGMAGSAGAKSFGGGMAAGAGANFNRQQQQVENDQKQQELNSNKIFRTAQAANMAADTAVKDAQLHNLPQVTQDAHNHLAAETAETYTKLFGNPTAVIPNDAGGASAMQHLKDTAAAQGGVDHMLVIPMGDKFMAWDTATVAKSANALSFVQSAGAALGLPRFSSINEEDWKKVPEDDKKSMIATANDVHGVTVPDLGNGGKNALAQMTRLSSEQRTLEAKVQADPTLQPLLDHVKSNYTLVKGAYDHAYADDLNKIKEASKSRGDAINGGKPLGVIDDEGNLRITRADTAIAGGYAPAAQGQKAMAQTQQLKEMQVASKNLGTVIAKMPDGGGFNSAQIAQIKAALGEASEGTVADVLKAKLANQQLSPFQEDFVVWLGQMQERAMALRSAAGIGQAGSDKLRAAITATLPNEKDSQSLMTKKNRAFQNQVTILMAGIPGVGRGGKNKTAPAVPVAATDSQPSGGPAVGTIKGGNPADPASWEKQ